MSNKPNQNKPEKKTVVVNTGISFSSFLALIFIAMKLTGVGVVAQWSWVWVLSPLWIGFAILAAVLFVIAGVVGLALIASNK